MFSFSSVSWSRLTTLGPKPLKSRRASSRVPERVSRGYSVQSSAVVWKATMLRVLPWLTGKVNMWLSGPICQLAGGGRNAKANR